MRDGQVWSAFGDANKGLVNSGEIFPNKNVDGVNFGGDTARVDGALHGLNGIFFVFFGGVLFLKIVGSDLLVSLRKNHGVSRVIGV